MCIGVIPSFLVPQYGVVKEYENRKRIAYAEIRQECHGIGEQGENVHQLAKAQLKLISTDLVSLRHPAPLQHQAPPLGPNPSPHHALPLAAPPHQTAQVDYPTLVLCA